METYEPVVSVLMPVYNVREDYLVASIKSILSQTLGDFELIIVDDGSSGRAGEIVRKHCARDPRIRLLVNGVNLGLAASLNRALEAAKGRYIARQDGDDISLPHRLRRQVDFLEDHPGIDLLTTGVLIMDQFGRVVSTWPFPGSPERIASRLAAGDNCLAHNSVMFRNRRGLFYRDKFRYSEDYDFYLQVLLDGRCLACLDEPLVYYRMAADEPFSRYIRRFFYILFKDLAKEYFDMRRQTGSDPYPRFDPRTLLNINVETTVDRTHLLLLIKLAVGGNYMGEARTLLRRYFRHYGPRPGYAALWLSTFMGGRAHRRLRKLLKQVTASCV